MSAFSENRRRILSLWLPRLPIDRIKRQLVREPIAFSSEVGTGSREENASKHKSVFERSGYRFAEENASEAINGTMGRS